MDLVLIILICLFFGISVYSVGAMFVMHGREQSRQDSEEIAKTLVDLDEALNASLAEINKLGALVMKEIEEKHRSVLFLYNLIDEKHKEITSIKHTEPDAISVMVEQFVQLHSEKLTPVSTMSPAPVEMVEISQPAKRPNFSNPTHARIWDLHESGMKISDIAKALNMGQGEVRLIIDLAMR